MFRRLLLLLVVCFLTPACRDFGDALKAYGYTELLPPSNLLTPGTVVVVENQAPFKTRIICTAKQSLGPKFRPVESQTAATTYLAQHGAKLDITAEVGAPVGGELGAASVRSVSASLTQPRLFELTDWHVAVYIGDRDPACTRAIQKRLAAGHKVTMVSGALQADATYSVEFEDSAKASVQAKNAALAGLAVKLGADASKTGKSEFSAKRLIWGVRTDSFLLAASMP